MMVLYTRNYQKREERDSPKNPEIPPKDLSLPAESIPEGYSGTAMLREHESGVTPPLSEVIQPISLENIPSPPLRTRKFKVKTKFSPTLRKTEDLPCCQIGDCPEEYGFDAQENAAERKETVVIDACICEKPCETDSEPCQKKPSSSHPQKRKHPFHRTPNGDNCDKRFSLEDLLLGGIILLLLNEGADDGMILIFGYLLFSSF